MKKAIITSFIIYLGIIPIAAQESSHAGYRNFPLMLTLQFHSVTLPFKNPVSSVRNIGIGIGTEVSLNGKADWVQEFQLIWYRNQQAGNGLLAFTQTAWKPEIAGHLHTGIKAGIGYQLSFHPHKTFKLAQGKWIPTKRAGKKMLLLTAGMAAEYHRSEDQPYLVPFAGYQFLLAEDYNQDLPYYPQTLLQAGSKVHF